MSHTDPEFRTSPTSQLKSPTPADDEVPTVSAVASRFRCFSSISNSAVRGLYSGHLYCVLRCLSKTRWRNTSPNKTPELDMGPFFLTQSNPVQSGCSNIQSNPRQTMSNSETSWLFNVHLQQASPFNCALINVDQFDDGREPAAQFPWQPNKIHHGYIFCYSYYQWRT